MVNFKVHTSSNGGHSAEVIAELCVNRLIHVADSAPPELSEQANALKDKMLEIITAYVKQAMVGERNTIAAQVEKNASSHVAAYIRSL